MFFFLQMLATYVIDQVFFWKIESFFCSKFCPYAKKQPVYSPSGRNKCKSCLRVAPLCCPLKANFADTHEKNWKTFCFQHFFGIVLYCSNSAWQLERQLCSAFEFSWLIRSLLELYKSSGFQKAKYAQKSILFQFLEKVTFWFSRFVLVFKA